jgi:hypothetical protein
MAERDPLLGWPRPNDIGTREYDSAFSRLVPAYPDPRRDRSCVAMFGDSFVWGDEVNPEETIANRLSELLNCRVANYGVSAYGTDQAFLRFRDRIQDDAPNVILAFYPHDILRNVTRYYYLLGNGPLYSFKPRFTLTEEGRLKLVPIPLSTADQAQDRSLVIEDLLGDDYFLPGGGSGTQWNSIPLSYRIVLAFGHYGIRARLTGRRMYTEFFDKDHVTKALAVTLAIYSEFAKTARARGQAPVALLIPDSKNIDWRRKGKPVELSDLRERLKKLGLPTVDLTVALKDRPPTEIYTAGGTGHLNSTGNELAALALKHFLEERNLTRPLSPMTRDH